MAEAIGTRHSSPIKALLPTKQYPHLKQLIHEVDFVCSNCSAGAPARVYITFAEAHKEPIGGHGKYTTRFGVMCPICGIPPQDGDFFESPGIIDLMRVPADYRRPKRPVKTSDKDLEFDEADETEGKKPKPTRATVPTENAKAKATRLKAEKQKAKLQPA